MISHGTVFGMRCWEATPEEWTEALRLANGSEESDCVIDARAGYMMIRPGSDVMERLRMAIPDLANSTL